MNFLLPCGFLPLASNVQIKHHVLRTCLYSILNQDKHALTLFAPDCSSWGLPARSTSGRSYVNPWGNTDYGFVSRGNCMVSRTLVARVQVPCFSGWSCVSCSFSAATATILWSNLEVAYYTCIRDGSTWPTESPMWLGRLIGLAFHSLGLRSFLLDAALWILVTKAQPLYGEPCIDEPSGQGEAVQGGTNPTYEDHHDSCHGCNII